MSGRLAEFREDDLPSGRTLVELADGKDPLNLRDEVGQTGYTLSCQTEVPPASAVERVREELAAEGFGVLCDIDARERLARVFDRASA